MLSHNKKFVFIFFLLFTISYAPFVFGQDSPVYELSAPIPGGVTETSSFGEYVGAIYPFGLSIAAGLAFIMIIVGGIQYIAAAGNTSQISDARSRIIHAVLGILLAALSFIILQAINPSLVNLNLDLTPVEFEGGGEFGNDRQDCEAQPDGSLLCIAAGDDQSLVAEENFEQQCLLDTSGTCVDFENSPTGQSEELPGNLPPPPFDPNGQSLPPLPPGPSGPSFPSPPSGPSFP